jgi:hypothetical protein
MDIGSAQSIVLETLQRASSQNAEILKPAELKLKEWETETGFYTTLLVSLHLIRYVRTVRIRLVYLP